VCDCGALDRAARDPELPVEFDAKLNEFNLVHGPGRMRIYHCWYCGGKAPESLRGTLFARISGDEGDRLFTLMAEASTLTELIERFGEPDRDSARGVVVETPERDGQAPTVEARRVLVYTKLSEVADVHVEVYPDDRVAILLQGKYIGPRNGVA
jgi:hypothetical protein